MQTHKLIAGIIVAFALTRDSEVHAACSLTNEMVEEEPRIYTVEKPNGLQLLYGDTVNLGTRLHLICDAQNSVIVTCGAGGRFRPNLPIKNCANPIKPAVDLINDPSCSANMYRVSYASRLTQGSSMEYYRSCYNVGLLNAQFSIHTVYDYSLVTARPSATWTTDRIITGANAATFQADKIYDRFKLLLGANQRYITNGRDYVIHRGHLAPSGDFLFNQGMSSTFKYINAVPQFGSINLRNWKSIENWVRSQVQTTGKFTVVTGSLDVLELRSTSGTMVRMYLATGNRNPIPKWIYKIVVGGNVRIVFVTLNNIFAQRAPAAICQTVNCPVQLPQTAASGYTHCCDVNDFKRLYFPNLNI